MTTCVQHFISSTATASDHVHSPVLGCIGTYGFLRPQDSEWLCPCSQAWRRGRGNEGMGGSCCFIEFSFNEFVGFDYETTRRYSNSYRIAENFRGRKLSQIGDKYDFRKENFRGLLACAAPKNATPQILQRKLSLIATKPRNSWKFLPRKFPAIRLRTPIK